MERAGFKELFLQASQNQTEMLAKVPDEVHHFALETFYERPVQADLVRLLLLPKDDMHFTSCILIHGMGGTGKTVTAVAAVRDQSLRTYFRQIFWCTVGADAVGDQLKQLQSTLHTQLANHSPEGEKSELEWQKLLVQAMAEKQRSLLVLDDPWMPAQVRFLNPIDSYHQTEHRLLVTTRIRDLVPNVTRVELPLMRNDEAVALLMNMAGIDKEAYRKDNPDGAWPPQAANAIAIECGLLPMTLTIAAQVVRSWGQGWETAVLPLLREQQEDLGQSATTRIIGAGLQALEKNGDGMAVKELFHMFAVTQVG